LSCFKVFIVM